jgi:hypothetical protein
MPSVRGLQVESFFDSEFPSRGGKPVPGQDGGPSGPDPALRERVEAAYAQFSSAFDTMVREGGSRAAAELNAASDALMRATARVLLALGR